ncbi:MAG: outer membrane protein transport protein, partial [Myxococcales bacterium]|nr:outer membrane protein transport protein [Myxococcales bacterium]
SVGMAGAFAAIADDATALSINPAGCAFAEPGGLVALELVLAPRSYVPIDAAGTRGPSEDASAFAPAPVLGILFKPGGADSPVTLGVGAWNSYGGILSWDPPASDQVAAITKSEELAFDVVMGGGWKIDDRFAIGASLRMGLGLFAVTAQKKPVNSDLSAIGIGVGANVGVMIRPTPTISIGAGWRSAMNVTTSGSGTLDIANVPTNVDDEHIQHWPQALSTSVAIAPSPDFLVAAQVDWTGWSSFESLDITFPGQSTGLNQHFDLDWKDTFTIRLGGQYHLGGRTMVRGGVLWDGNAVPDRTIERQYLDSSKYSASLGATFGVSSRMVLDVGADAVFGPKRVVADNSGSVSAQWPEQVNTSPGEHSGQVFTLVSGLRIAL